MKAPTSMLDEKMKTKKRSSVEKVGNAKWAVLDARTGAYEAWDCCRTREEARKLCAAKNRKEELRTNPPHSYGHAGCSIEGFGLTTETRPAQHPENRKPHPTKPPARKSTRPASSSEAFQTTTKPII
jgi:hypothetical protein